MIPRTLFAPEHEQFRDSVRRFIEREITPHHERWEEQGMVDRELWQFDLQDEQSVVLLGRLGNQPALCSAHPSNASSSVRA